MAAVKVLAGETSWAVECGDCLDLLRALPDACADAMVVDPPAGISFMGRSWDQDKGGRDEWIAWLADRMREALRVLKPGAHALVWALPRTSHWTGMALEHAGFEVRDRLAHLFGSGFPKSLDVSKAIDRAAGAEREVVGPDPWGERRRPNGSGGASHGEQGPHPGVTAPATADAARWAGWGTALKPACEDWWLVRKPMKTSVAKNIAAHGTGAINVDACRVPHASADDLASHTASVDAIKARGGSMDNSWANHSDLSGASDVSALGRWPAHVLLSHAEGCQRVGTRKVKAAPPWTDKHTQSLFTGEETSRVHHTAGDGFEVVAAWQCVDGCPVLELDQSENASRYFTTFAGAACGANSTKAGGMCAGAIQGPEKSEASLKAAGYGNRQTDLFPGDTKFTTEITTTPITGCQISSASPRGGTTITTSDCANTTASLTDGKNDGARGAENTDSCQISTFAEPEPITDIASRAPSHMSEHGDLESVPAFIYAAKASRDDREKGCEYLPRRTGGEATGRKDGSAGLNSPRAGAGRGGGRRNIHPTAKNTELMRWLVRLVCPAGGIVIDPFCGSGSTGVACSAEGVRFIGMELDPEYAEIARARIIGDCPLFNTIKGA